MPVRTFLPWLMLVATAWPAYGQDWPARRGPANNGISSETNWSDQWPADGPPVLWRAEVGTGFSGMVVAADRLFTMGNREEMDSIVCLDANNGQLIWQHQYASPLDDRDFEGGPTSTPTVDENRLYSLSRAGDLFCLDAISGKVLWSKNVQQATEARIPGWGFSSSPVIDQQRLLVGVGEAGLALDKLTGEILWQSGTGEAGYMTPLVTSVGARRIAIIASGKFYQGVDAATGQLLWKHRWLTTYGCNAADPVIDGNRLFISSGYGRGAALLELAETEFKVLWSGKQLANQTNSSLLIDGHLFGFDGNHGGEVRLKCIEFATGHERWSASGFGSGALTAAGKRLIILSEQGELVIAPGTPDAAQADVADSLRILARAKILDEKCWTVPVLCRGRIYCRSISGAVACVDVRLPDQPQPR